MTVKTARPRFKTAALLVIDTQEYFRPLAESILPNLQKLIHSFRQHRIPVIYTQHGHEHPDMDGGMVYQWWGDVIQVGSPEAEIIPEIAPQPEEKIVAKKRYSAFYDTDLEDYLKKLGITDVIIAGVMTNLCCETTARDAFVRDYRVFFLSDGTATALDEYHQATLINLAYGFAYIVKCEQIIALLNQSEDLLI